MGHYQYENSYSSEKAYFGSEPSRWIEPYLPSGDDIRVLDVGSGQGRNSIYLGRQGYNITAIDSSRAAIRDLRRAVQRDNLPITIVCSNINSYPLPQETYDVILAISVLCHLDPGTIHETGGRITRALRPGGLLIAEEFTPDDPGACEADNASEFAPLIENYFTPDDLQQLFVPLRTIHSQVHTVKDTTHGGQHEHSLIRYVARREG